MKSCLKDNRSHLESLATGTSLILCFKKSGLEWAQNQNGALVLNVNLKLKSDFIKTNAHVKAPLLTQPLVH